MAGCRTAVNRSGSGEAPGNGRTVTGWPGQQPVFVLPEEGLEPTRTYAQALLRRPRLPFRHSGVPDIVSNASNARIALTSQTLVWHQAPLAWGDAPSAARVGRRAGASISRVRSLGTYQGWRS